MMDRIVMAVRYPSLVIAVNMVHTHSALTKVDVRIEVWEIVFDILTLTTKLFDDNVDIDK